ncbi:MAG: 30S ribosomal protein S13 [Candidatus Omnitrophica bacterium CG11_big_fil_rev_8_21_14_0_20_42_13]|uniref:Small ribosomal subunit protein uS13 n=1 Tax=Candidatus Ghiorseimicrobium undicola TaxID=1974746 RepID=A0A2H0LVB8_9BACT|nr:MAG: 30S ribosomal protein S13 [Candidatus Omnitrophica bacterium CG11_big_fil_rev_8_21_14_0_20_42_13]
MPRILGVDIPKEKKIEAALPYLYGIGKVSASKILKAAEIDPNRRAKTLTDEEISKIVAVIQRGYKIEGDLRREVSQNIKRLMDIGSYRGLRHKRSLPVHGQRTRTNSRTRKGPRRNVGAIKAKAEK